MPTSLLQALPVEILHRILDHLDARTICLSFRYVCKRFHTIADTYTQYELSFESTSKTEFALICRIIHPENVLSLRLRDNNKTPNQIKLFCSLLDIRRFTRLRSATFEHPDEPELRTILKHIATCSLTSLSIDIGGLWFKRVSRVPGFLASVLNQRTLRKLCLHVSHQLNEKSWPKQCTLHHLTMNSCTLGQYCTILQHSPLLQTVVLTNCQSIMKNVEEMISPTSILPSFRQVKSLTLDSINYKTTNGFEFFLSMTPLLIHLRLTSQGTLFNNSQWEEIVEAKLLFLTKFEFFFGYELDLHDQHADIPALIAPFQTPFWLGKHWFVTCDYIVNERLINIYSVPICISVFSYVVESDKISCSTNPIKKNDTTAMDNVHVLKLNLAQVMDAAMKDQVCFKEDMSFS
jgi:hypothetical protein